MKSKSSFVARFSLLAVVIFALAGCWVSGKQIDGALEACRDHGGVKELQETASHFYRAYCNDGTSHTGPIK